MRQGQDEGTVKSRGNSGGTGAPGHRGAVPGVGRGQHLDSPADLAGVTHRSDLVPIYAMADTPLDDFDAAIDEARAEGNLSRANVVRKVKGCTDDRRPRYCQGPPVVPPRNDPTPRAGLKVEPYVYGGVVGPVERKVPPPDAPGPAPQGRHRHRRCMRVGVALVGQAARPRRSQAVAHDRRSGSAGPVERGFRHLAPGPAL